MKTLVIVCAGDSSLHPTWELDKRHFDLWISYYGSQSGRYAHDGDAYQQRKGFKYPVIHEWLGRSDVTSYDFVACPDDDMAWTSDKFQRAFELMAEYQLDVAQPGITGAGTVFKPLLARPGQVGRFVDMVEVMTPIFSRTALQRLLWTFNESQSGWGMDLLWSAKYPEHRMAVLDCVPVPHTRPQGHGDTHQNIAQKGIAPHDELINVLERHGLPQRVHCASLGPLIPLGTNEAGPSDGTHRHE